MQLRFVLNNKKKEIHLSYLCIASFFIMDLQINDKPLLKSKRETFYKNCIYPVAHQIKIIPSSIFVARNKNVVIKVKKDPSS